MREGGHHTEATKQKMSKARLGEKNPNYGKKAPEETKQKNREAHLKRYPTEETKQKMREAHLGARHTEVTKQKMREARLGTHSTEETKQKMREALSGEKHPCYGKKLPKETKQKIGEAQLGEKNHGWKGGSELSRARSEEKRRELGFVPLNDNFIGAHGHHIDKELVLYIPKELHRSVPHNVHTDQGMEEINNLACEYVYGIKTEG